MTRSLQALTPCLCGRMQILATRVCGTCSNRNRQNGSNSGRLPEAVLEGDGHRCSRQAFMVARPRVPGRSGLLLMIKLCPGCDAKVHGTS